MGANVSGYKRRRARLRRRAHRVRRLPQLPRRSPPPLHEHRRHRRPAGRLFRRVPLSARHPTRGTCIPRIPSEIACFLDPLGNATHSALSFDLVGEDVLITGAGPIGIMAAAICRHCGAQRIVVTDVNDYRLGPRGADGRHADGERDAHLHRGGAEEAVHHRVRHRPGDVGQRGRLRVDAGEHVPRRSHRAPGHPSQLHRASGGTRSSSRA